MRWVMMSGSLLDVATLIGCLAHEAGVGGEPMPGSPPTASIAATRRSLARHALCTAIQPASRVVFDVSISFNLNELGS
jgi:hypothetical protein